MRLVSFALLLVLALAGALAAAGCSRAGDAASSGSGRSGSGREALAGEPLSNEPFSTLYTLEAEQRAFSLSGGSAGHIAGDESDFELWFDNRRSGTRWQADYAVVLVDSAGILEEVRRDRIDLEAGGSCTVVFQVLFPPGSQGPLGLEVILPGCASTASTLWVGDDRSRPAGPWPQITALPD